MDQHVEKAENNFQESTDRDEEKEEGSAEESMDQRNEHKEVAEEINKGSEEEEAAAGTAASPRFAHPCSLLQYLLRSCAGCLGLHCYCSDPKTAAVAPEAAAPPANSSQEGDGGGKTNFFCMQEVVTRARAVMRRPRGPDRPGEGRGGDGGDHH